MINIFLFFVCFLIRITSHTVDGIRDTVKEDLLLKRHFKDNQSPVKSIHTKFGYIVDCIDIDKQPAFDHPLLKSHELQRKSSFQRIIKQTSVNISRTKPMFGLENKHCPKGTIPIQRTPRDDLIQTKSFVHDDTLHYHGAQVSLDAVSVGTSFYAVGGSNSVYNPRVENNQTSASFIWVQNGHGDVFNTITFGWHVYPALYKDDKTHVFVSWTADNYKKTGCYNLQCPGFVQIDNTVVLGGTLDNISVYGGPSVEVQFLISQDLKTKDWLLFMDGTTIGYFPASLFPNMASADDIGWGGQTSTYVGSSSPIMGSGYFPDGQFIHACYFKNVIFQDDSRKSQGPKINVVEIFNDKPQCYGVKFYGYQPGGNVGSFIEFGGPGGNCGD